MDWVRRECWLREEECGSGRKAVGWPLGGGEGKVGVRRRFMGSREPSCWPSWGGVNKLFT